MDRLFTSVLADDVEATAGFYVSLFGMQKHFESDWFVILVHADKPGIEFGVLASDSDVVPVSERTAPAGMMVTFVVDDCDAHFATATALGAAVVEPPTVMPYGQKRALVRDPAGTLLDISSPVSANPG